MVLFVGP